MDRRETNPSSAAGHQDTFLHRSGCFCGWRHHGKCHATTCTNRRSRHLRQTPRVAGPHDPQGANRAGRSGEDGRVRKSLALGSAESAGMNYLVLAPKRPFPCLQSSARDCTEKYQEDLGWHLRKASPDSKCKQREKGKDKRGRGLSWSQE